MSKLGKIISLAALAVAAALLGLGSLVFIQPAQAADEAAVSAHGGRGFCGQAGLDAAAGALGLTADELMTQMRGGESLADLADEAGVELEAVLESVDAACAAATRESIEQAVTDGTLTREKADWLLEGLDKGFWGVRGEGGFGPGLKGIGGRRDGGFGGFGGFPGFGQPPLKLSATPDTDA
jgi:hypothetical protein